MSLNRYDAGRLAFNEGRAISDHEYSPGSLSETQWREGWETEKASGLTLKCSYHPDSCVRCDGNVCEFGLG